MYKNNDMKLSQFRFKLPEEQIAQFPASYRDEARLMILHRRSGEIEHVRLPELVNYFEEGDLFVFNENESFFSEIKGNSDSLSYVQVKKHEVLLKAGIQVVLFAINIYLQK